MAAGTARGRLWRRVVVNSKPERRCRREFREVRRVLCRYVMYLILLVYSCALSRSSGDLVCGQHCGEASMHEHTYGRVLVLGIENNLTTLAAGLSVELDVCLCLSSNLLAVRFV